MRLPLAFAAFVALFSPPTASGEWLSLRSEHFQVIGEAGESELRNVALKFEQFRDAISQLNPAMLGKSSAPPVVIVVFKDRNTFRPFMPVVDGNVVPVGGFFQPGDDINYIALTLESAGQGLPVVFHEFAHLLLRGVFNDAPVWFNEGLAEYYSTFEVTSSRSATIGKPRQDHLGLLRSRTMPFARFFAIDRRSPEYIKDSMDRTVLYAQAWAIVHHALHGEPKRRDQLLAFVTMVADGGSTEESFRAAYGIDVRDLEREMQTYVRLFSHGHSTYEFKDDLVARIDAHATGISQAEADAWLGDLLAHMDRDEEAEARIGKALNLNKDLALAHASLGALQMRQGKIPDGLAHLEEAQELGTGSETAYYLYASALVSQDGLGSSDPDGLRQASRALQRALVLRPGYTQARLLLGYVYLASGEHASARDLLLPLVRAEPTNHLAALRLGEALVALHDFEGVRSTLAPVIARATDVAERDRANMLLEKAAELEKLSQAPPRPGRPTGDATADKSPGPKRARVIPVFRGLVEGERRVMGVFEAVQCSPKGVVFVVRTSDDRVLRPHAATFDDVEFLAYRALPSTSINCGAQKPAMDVYLTWRPPQGSPDATEGTAVAIEVLPEGLAPER